MPKQKPTSRVTEADYRHLAAFRHALREFLHFSEEAAGAAGLPPRQYQAMLAIRGLANGEPLTVGELASRLKIRHHSAVGLVNRMEADGLVAKSQDPRDRRQVLVRLTPRGESNLEKLATVHKAELTRIAPALREILKQLGSKT